MPLVEVSLPLSRAEHSGQHHQQETCTAGARSNSSKALDDMKQTSHSTLTPSYKRLAVCRAVPYSAFAAQAPQLAAATAPVWDKVCLSL
jgi:hypothetical protein